MASSGAADSDHRATGFLAGPTSGTSTGYGCCGWVCSDPGVPCARHTHGTPAIMPQTAHPVHVCVLQHTLKAVTVLQTQTCTGCAVALLGTERRQKIEANRRQRVARACWASCLVGLLPHWTADLRVVAGWSHPLWSSSAIARLSSHCLVCAWGRGGGV
jgi:hypothetical protein